MKLKINPDHKWLNFALLAAGVSTSLYGVDRKNFEIYPNKNLLKGKKEYLESLQKKFQDENENQLVKAKKEKPNLLFIVVDDLGKYDCSLYGEEGAVKTPYLEELGASGAVFDSGLCSAPICSPSRAGILTGRQQQRFGFEYRLATIYPATKGIKKMAEFFVDLGNMKMSDQEIFPNKKQMRQQGIPKSEIILPEIVKTAGYRTSLVGKWDVGYANEMEPWNFGFDDSYGFLEAYTLFAPLCDPTIVESRQDNFQNRFIWSQGRKGTCAIFRNGKTINEKEYLTFAFSREAIKIIDARSERRKEARAKNEGEGDPFFIYLAFNAPHTPFQAPLRYYNLFPEVKDHNKRVYYAMIKALDDAIGDVMQKLKRSGEWENTLICFCSDNGGAEYTLATENGPLKAGKFSNFEGAINIPYLISWPSQIPAGQRIKSPVSTLDFFVTATTAAGITLPSDRPYDGKNLLPALQQKVEFDKNRIFFWRAGYNKCCREGDWKLVVNEKSGQRELYHLKNDPYEKTNLKANEEKRFEAMWGKYQEWDKSVQKEAWPHVMDYGYMIDGELYYFAL